MDFMADPVSIGIVVLLLIIYYDEWTASDRTLAQRPRPIKVAMLVTSLAGPPIIVYRAMGAVPAAITAITWTWYNFAKAFRHGI